MLRIVLFFNTRQPKKGIKITHLSVLRTNIRFWKNGMTTKGYPPTSCIAYSVVSLRLPHYKQSSYFLLSLLLCAGFFSIITQMINFCNRLFLFNCFVVIIVIWNLYVQIFFDVSFNFGSVWSYASLFSALKYDCIVLHSFFKCCGCWNKYLVNILDFYNANNTFVSYKINLILLEFNEMIAQGCDDVEKSGGYERWWDDKLNQILISSHNISNQTCCKDNGTTNGCIAECFFCFYISTEFHFFLSILLCAVFFSIITR